MLNSLRSLCCAVLVTGSLWGCALFIDNTDKWIGQDAMVLGPRFGNGTLIEPAEGKRRMTFWRKGSYMSTKQVQERAYDFLSKKYITHYVSYPVVQTYDCTMAFDLDDNNRILEVLFYGEDCYTAFPEKRDYSWKN